MVKFEVRADLLHRTVKDYYCVVVQFEEADKHFFKTNNNWVPTDREAITLFKILYGLSPTFRTMIKKELGDQAGGE